MIYKIKNSILDFMFKHSFIISIIITITVLKFYFCYLVTFFDNSKNEVLNIIISVSGTLFGFILTFLSIIIVFKTDDKYKINEENKSKPLIILLNNKSFEDVYDLFIRCSYSLGWLLIVSLIYYFTTYGLKKELNCIFVILITGLIITSIVQVFISILLFNRLIKILVKNKQ